MGQSDMRSLRALAILVLLGLPAGCGGASTVGSAAEPGAVTSVTVYAKGASGNVAPVRIIAGSRTLLQFPSAVAVDAHGNRYVANRGADSVTVYGSNARGNASPLRTIAGTRTGLNLPTGLALDARGDVYVVNRAANTITVYAPTANGNTLPIRTIKGSKTDLNGPTSIAVDGKQNLFVTNLGGQSVTTFARGASGDVAPVRIIHGKQAELTAAFGIVVDQAANVYVVNSDDKGITGVLVFGPHAGGNVAPTRVISGSATKLETPSGVAVDSSGAIFVSDHGGSSNAGAVRVFAKGANGDAAPIYSIGGSATRLRPYGLTIDQTGEINVVNVTD
jgi:hypothetical protein